LKEDYFCEFGTDRNISLPNSPSRKSNAPQDATISASLDKTTLENESLQERPVSVSDGSASWIDVSFDRSDAAREEFEPKGLAATLEQERQQILDSFKSQESEAIRETDQALTTLSQLQSILATHIEQQSYMVDKIYDDVHDTVDSLSSGYDYLKRAKENSDEFLKTAAWLLLILSFVLLFLDWLN
jgi:hypothetical protein